ncbi:hypothetical protein RRG08_009431 [Elysia crispata]|uniref:Uncharacterized protein n=1 Tax=Elysia crispata TaxID=231223 RepID=A0AAE0Y931_9GAST|nr:hypothetical protein RRG08_009431 [Elysia crispata]
MVPLAICTDCPVGTYGVGCLRSCSPNCAGSNKTCHTVLGWCDQGCIPGFDPPYCTTGCAVLTVLDLTKPAIQFSAGVIKAVFQVLSPPDCTTETPGAGLPIPLWVIILLAVGFFVFIITVKIFCLRKCLKERITTTPRRKQ